MKPIIGVMPLFDEQKNSIWMIPGYMQGIENAGGVPVILPLTANGEELNGVIGLCDGFLFTGGQDVDPTVYGEQRLPTCGEPCELRDRMEEYVLGIALKRDVPVLGICRGIQIINAVLGGTLYQDLTGFGAINHHMSPPYDRAVHGVTLSSPLKEIIGASRMGVNSYHHQGIKTLASDLEAAAISEDGLAEAVTMRGKKFFIAVQWHPELWDCAASRALFGAFVSACQ